MKNKILGLIGVFAVLIIAIGGFLIFRNEDLDIDSKLVQDLYKKVNPSDNLMILSMLYKEPGKVENGFYVSAGLKYYIDKNGFQENISINDISDSIYEIFGEEANFYHERAYILADEYCGYDYNKTLKRYEFLSGCSGSYDSMERKAISASKDKNYLYIYEKSIYIVHDIGIDGAHYTIYNNMQDLKKLAEKTDKNGNYNIKLDDYLDEASTYKYVFKKVKNNYIFDHLELVKDVD